MWRDLEAVVGRRWSRPPPAEAFNEAQHNCELAQRREQLQGRITAELSGTDRAFAWYALCVAPAHERVAAAHLVARRFGIFLPTLDHMTSQHGRRVPRQDPMLPGYIFISSVGLIWRRALSCPGVTGLLHKSGSDEPAEIPQSFIEVLQVIELEQNGALRRNRKAHRGYRKRAAERGEDAFTIRSFCWSLDGVDGLPPELEGALSVSLGPAS